MWEERLRMTHLYWYSNFLSKNMTIVNRHDVRRTDKMSMLITAIIKK